MKEQMQFLMQRIEALETENKRLNDELRKVKDVSFKVRLSDPNFDKPLCEIETDFEIVKSEYDKDENIIVNENFAMDFAKWIIKKNKEELKQGTLSQITLCSNEQLLELFKRKRSETSV